MVTATLRTELETVSRQQTKSLSHTSREIRSKTLNPHQTTQLPEHPPISLSPSLAHSTMKKTYRDEAVRQPGVREGTPALTIV